MIVTLKSPRSTSPKGKMLRAVGTLQKFRGEFGFARDAETGQDDDRRGAVGDEFALAVENFRLAEAQGAAQADSFSPGRELPVCYRRQVVDIEIRRGDPHGFVELREEAPEDGRVNKEGKGGCSLFLSLKGFWKRGLCLSIDLSLGPLSVTYHFTPVYVCHLQAAIIISINKNDIL